MESDDFQKLVKELRLSVPQKLAEELVSVQPMPSSTFKDLYAASTSREELIANGYRPVSRMGLMWIKDETSKELDLEDEENKE